MQLYAVALTEGQAPAPDLAGALRAAAVHYPGLDAAAVRVERSPGGRVHLAWLGPDEAFAAPRRYAARSDDVVALFDGFPVERSGRYAAHDAAELLRNWDAAPGELDGVFSALRVDLGAETVEVLLDVLGIAPAFVRRAGGSVQIANSVEALRALGASDDVDPVGVSSLLSLGWPAAGRTLLREVRFLEPGGRHRLTPSGARFEPYLDPATVRRAAVSSEEMVDRLREATRAAVDSGVVVTSALSSGRDTRVLLALLHAVGAEHDAVFYTSGLPEDLDSQVAKELCARWGLAHRYHLQEPPRDDDEWRAQTDAFIARGDGMASIESISDHMAHAEGVERLPLELWGAGGEIGRKVKWVGSSLAGLTPLARKLDATQRRLLHRSAIDGGGLLTPRAVGESTAFLDDFLAARRAEGWPAEHAIDLLYAFGRVRHWAARGVRRAAASADLFSPFISRAYIEHCLNLPVGARYVEQPPRRLIDALWPEVDATRYEFAWRPQRPRLAFGLVLSEGARRVVLRSRGEAVSADGPPFGQAWFEAGIEQHRELADAFPDSPVWAFVDRDCYRTLVNGSPEARAPVQHVLNRVLTVLWYLHGRHTAPVGHPSSNDIDHSGRFRL